MSGTQNDVVVPILLPQAGNTMEEGTILRWAVAVGDTVKAGDVLFELETDKATIEVEAECAGRVARIVVGEGQTAAVKTPVAYLADSEEALSRVLSGAPSAPVPTKPDVSLPPPGSPLLSATPVEPSVSIGTRPKASPVARRAAESLGVRLESIGFGSGPDGRILLEDVQKAATSSPAVPAASGHATVAARPTATGGSRRPMDKMRRAIGRNLSLSKQTLPHWYTKITIDAEPMLAFAKREKQHYPCTVTDVIVWAVARVVSELPLFRTQIDGEDLVEFPSANIGLAVGTDAGLVVPVLVGADQMSLKGVAAATKRLVENARAGKLEGVGEAVFSISNLGMFGVEEFAAIINPPESGILSVGAVREEVVVKNGAMRPGKVMTMVLSADHRLIDGTLAAKFASRIKELLESPDAGGSH